MHYLAGWRIHLASSVWTIDGKAARSVASIRIHSVKYPITMLRRKKLKNLPPLLYVSFLLLLSRDLTACAKTLGLKFAARTSESCQMVLKARLVESRCSSNAFASRSVRRYPHCVSIRRCPCWSWHRKTKRA
jgi:hypothetical protein